LRADQKEVIAAEKAAIEWWRTEGIYIDPDTDDVDWFDKRSELAQLAFIAGLKRLWLLITLRIPHQCDGCLNWFIRGEVEWVEAPHCHKIRKPGDIGCRSFMCAECRKLSRTPYCFCGC
jgi:hypothetical protein